MSMLPAFPKIHALGSRENHGIFNEEVEITEKLDGSAVAFGVIDGKLHIRSKSREIDIDNPDKMFALGVGIIKDRYAAGLLVEGYIYYGEYLRDRRHNVLMYARAPVGQIALYGLTGMDGVAHSYELIKNQADYLSLDVVELLFKGQTGDQDTLASLLTQSSALGGAQIEGIVVKNYNKAHLMMGKYVNEKFKEISGGTRGPKILGQTRFESYKATFKTTARWHKAVQHLRDQGLLQDSPKDIGALLKELNLDITAEESYNIKEWLWDEFGKQILKAAGEGFPQWYKEQLLKQSTDEIGADLGGS